MRHASLVSVLVLTIAALAACSSGDADGGAAAGDSLTRAERDTAIAESRLPGARGVEGAMDASDAARERAARVDSLEGD